MVLRESLEWICVRIPYALRRTDAPPAYAVTHIVKPRESLLTSHMDMRKQCASTLSFALSIHRLAEFPQKTVSASLLHLRPVWPAWGWYDEMQCVKNILGIWTRIHFAWRFKITISTAKKRFFIYRLCTATRAYLVVFAFTSNLGGDPSRRRTPASIYIRPNTGGQISW